MDTRGTWSDRAAEQLGPALEDRIYWDIDATLAIANRIEREATEHDDAALIMRARLVKANMWMRSRA